MPSFLAQYKTFANPETQGRVAFAAMDVAQEVLNEGTLDPNYEQRRAFGTWLLTDPIGRAGTVTKEIFLVREVLDTCTDAGTLGATDEQIRRAVADVWTRLAVKLGRV